MHDAHSPLPVCEGVALPRGAQVPWGDHWSNRDSQGPGFMQNWLLVKICRPYYCCVEELCILFKNNKSLESLIIDKCKSLEGPCGLASTPMLNLKSLRADCLKGNNPENTLNLFWIPHQGPCYCACVPPLFWHQSGSYQWLWAYILILMVYSRQHISKTIWLLLYCGRHLTASKGD